MPPDLVEFNVGGKHFTTTIDTISFDKRSALYMWYIERKGSAHYTKDKTGAYFIDRDPYTFSIILNYLRLQSSKQMWETCLPKDPDRLALLTQEAEFFRLPLLRDQAIALLHTCTEKSDPYVNEMLSKSTSCPQGFDVLKNLRLTD
ncbi:BTB/POZ domain-containing protein [Ditylenchus destructor]|uniref:BTB/POZ domain-containing protein n=1 Tax=Ditylenchus destructor TaxID=166010 RepID=A0AAD4R0X1_9BILA|nr:BTB/POZ domain-containing protein [Ditylenchus destructor]